MDSFVSEGFICTAHDDVVAVLVQLTSIVTRHAIEVRERALNGLAVDICAVHEKLFPIREQETFECLLHTLRFITEQQE